MGPTNEALVKLLHADRQLRQARQRLEEATRNVRIRERRMNGLREQLQSAQETLRNNQTRGAELDLDLKSRDAHLEKLRAQQLNAQNDKIYKALLVEINTEKVDRAKVEDQALTAMQAIEQGQKEAAELAEQVQGAQAEVEALHNSLADRVAQLQKEIDALQPVRDEAAAEVPPRARETFDRLAERFDGVAMSALGKPNPKREEYICTECNMSLVVDVYNRLHMRDELAFCPSCQRILYIPDALTPEHAVNRKEKREPKVKAPPAAVNRQSSAEDVLNSVKQEE